MDSVTLTPAEAPPGDIGSSLGSSMPGFAPLAMPAQSFRRFSRRDRRAWVNPRLAATPLLSRLAVFGGAVALTVYGADQMYKVVGVGTTTALEWVLVVLFVITFSWLALSFTSSVVGFIWLLTHPRKPGPSARARCPKGPPSSCRSTTRRRRASLARCRRCWRTSNAPASARRSTISSSPTRPTPTSGSPRNARFVAMRERLPKARIYLSPPPQELEPQSRQHRRLCHPLGRTLSPHAGARRRQPHGGRDDRSARGGDGGGPGRRHHPEPAAHRQPQHDVRPPAAICGPHRRPRHCRGTDRLDGARRQLLGP